MSTTRSLVKDRAWGFIFGGRINSRSVLEDSFLQTWWQVTSGCDVIFMVRKAKIVGVHMDPNKPLYAFSLIARNYASVS